MSMESQASLRWPVGSYLDAKDTLDHWLDARVLKTHGTNVFIHYTG